jgi:hypothetical protein
MLQSEIHKLVKFSRKLEELSGQWKESFIVRGSSSK